MVWLVATGSPGGASARPATGSRCGGGAGAPRPARQAARAQAPPRAPARPERRRRRLGRLARRRRVQRRDQFAIVTRRLAAGRRQPADDRLDPVQPRQDHGHGIGRRGQHAVAHLAQHVLGRVRHPFQPRQAEESAGALDRVDQAEDQRQRRLVVRRALQFQQGDVQIGDAFVGLGQEIGDQIVHGSPLEPGATPGGAASWSEADEQYGKLLGCYSPRSDSSSGGRNSASPIGAGRHQHRQPQAGSRRQQRGQRRLQAARHPPASPPRPRPRRSSQIAETRPARRREGRRSSPRCCRAGEPDSATMPPPGRLSAASSRRFRTTRAAGGGKSRAGLQPA